MEEKSKLAHLIAGCFGGYASTLVLHPLDLLKVRLQVQEQHGSSAQYKGTLNSLRSIARSEGLVGLYRGVMTNSVGAGLAWGSYFFGYEHAKRRLRGSSLSTPLQHMTAAGLAGAFTLLLTNPVWVVKTRMCLQGDKGSAQPYRYRGLADGLVSVYRGEGLAGLYKGFLPGLFGVSHGMVQFVVYEELKARLNAGKQRLPNANLDTIEYLSIAAVSKAAAQVATYPYQVVRSYLQRETRSGSEGAVQVLLRLVRQEGVLGLYKGLFVNLLRVLPASCLTFVVYEHTRAFMETVL